jgi:hypothetical protein
MSGLFQRIARRDAERPDDPSTTAPADPVDAPTQQFEAPDGAGQLDAPTVVQPAIAEAPSSDAAPAAAPPDGSSASAGEPSTEEQAPAAEPRRPGFRERGRMRRRLRYLRKLRELQLRDLGGLIFDLKRFGRQRDDLMALKLDQVRACDDELRMLETALDERRDIRDIREPGIGGTCPRCFAIYGSTDRFCAHCGAALGGAAQGPAPAPEPVAAEPPAATAPQPAATAPQPATAPESTAAEPQPAPSAPEPTPPAEADGSTP